MLSLAICIAVTACPALPPPHWTTFRQSAPNIGPSTTHVILFSTVLLAGCHCEAAGGQLSSGVTGYNRLSAHLEIGNQVARERQTFLLHIEQKQKNSNRFSLCNVVPLAMSCGPLLLTAVIY